MNLSRATTLEIRNMGRVRGTKQFSFFFFLFFFFFSFSLFLHPSMKEGREEERKGRTIAGEGCGRKTFFSTLFHLKTTTSQGRRLMDAKNIAAGIAGVMVARGGCTPLAGGEKQPPLSPVTAHYALFPLFN